MSDDIELENFDQEAVNAPAEEEVEGGQRADKSINSMLRVNMPVQVVIGATKMTVEQLMKVSRGAVIELDRRIGEPVDVMVNDRVVARGDLVDVGDGTVGVNLKEIVKEHITKEL